MKKILIVSLAITTALFFWACKDSSHDHSGHDHSGHGHHSHSHGNTKIVVVDDIQVAFDLWDSAAHDEMMKKMNVKAHDHGASDHFIGLTIANKSEKKLVKGANVSVKVTGPDNKVQENPVHVMEGAGMYHYAAPATMTQKGEYTVSATVKAGDKQIQADTKFTIE